MLLVRLICTDCACAELHEELVWSLTALDALACACGCTLQAVEIAAWEPAVAGRPVAAPLAA